MAVVNWCICGFSIKFYFYTTSFVALFNRIISVVKSGGYFKAKIVELKIKCYYFSDNLAWVIQFQEELGNAVFSYPSMKSRTRTYGQRKRM